VCSSPYSHMLSSSQRRHYPSDFLANSYLNVYQGHIDTFHYIQEHRTGAFHLMMLDIYAQARCVSSFINLLSSLIYYYIFSAGEEATAVLIAVIDLEELEE